MNSEKIKIIEKYKGFSGVEYQFEYEDLDSFDNLDYSLCKQVYGVCFCDNKIVIGYGGHKKTWGLIGGTIEKGETFEETFKREIIEESNMEIVSWKPIGVQKVIDTRDGSHIFQLRAVAIVKPLGPFVSDPANVINGITEIKHVDPSEYKNYFDWGQIGDRIISRALELREGL